ncbi:hypothetical protein SAMD00019534_091950, partial [Acytostelium subglobosum LB1]|uniref:hypothetical protein n=1 Tax=Acytostelium subglobosum LB1 TaxID=1410327 RepID=UPI0006450A57
MGNLSSEWVTGINGACIAIINGNVSVVTLAGGGVAGADLTSVGVGAWVTTSTLGAVECSNLTTNLGVTGVGSAWSWVGWLAHLGLGDTTESSITRVEETLVVAGAVDWSVGAGLVVGVTDRVHAWSGLAQWLVLASTLVGVTH